MSNIKLDNEYLESLGYSDLEQDAKTEKIGDLFRLLYSRIARKLTNDLSDKKLNEYLVVVQSEELVEPWLQANVPNYEELIQDELVTMRDEINADREDIRNKLEAAMKKTASNKG